MFLVRDWMAYQMGPPSQPIANDPPDLLLVAVHDALKDVATCARWDMPELFVKVDKLKSRPGRQAQRALQPFVYDGPVRVCEYCHTTFPVFGIRTNYCSAAHRHAHKVGV